MIPFGGQLGCHSGEGERYQDGHNEGEDGVELGEYGHNHRGSKDVVAGAGGGDTVGANVCLTDG